MYFGWYIVVLGFEPLWDFILSYIWWLLILLWLRTSVFNCLLRLDLVTPKLWGCWLFLFESAWQNLRWLIATIFIPLNTVYHLAVISQWSTCQSRLTTLNFNVRLLVYQKNGLCAIGQFHHFWIVFLSPTVQRAVLFNAIIVNLFQGLQLLFLLRLPFLTMTNVFLCLHTLFILIIY